MLNGILFFPITPFDSDGDIDHAALTDHIDTALHSSPGGVFVACGTGEFHALSTTEIQAAVRTAVTVTVGRAPVFAGVGGPLRSAVELAAAVEAEGADGILLLPPYLVSGPTAGLLAYVAAVAAATTLPVIVYHRATARFDEASAVQVARIPNVIGLKDGVGDVDLMSRIVRAVTDATREDAEEFLFFNGLPTAEVSQPAYKAIGVPLYSSATFAFAPEIALAYYDALESGDTATVELLAREFFHPLVRLRDRVPGYPVALVKAGAGLNGVAAGGVRAPLVDPTPEHLAELTAIIAAGRAALAARSAAATAV
ncbi:5-dehydro-4-deoxyglucarate dehydratase [Rathayibacter sp. VKM Ac-2835]|uniref:5-dehydro-4-deoxyglucarate dehydratase n=1 Tax=Rathayibacter sp. VKM Ac-2835 TaxID=2739043 RepID=UPI0015641CB2|nr:5-dehydro-4-deoxyglucarate dehydratase [Rathayibacter sp. VKM Ac-2835]